MSTLRVNTVTDSAGSGNPDVGIDTSGIAKAWVNFNGGGTVAIRGSFNVSSITDNGTGDYTVNFTTAMIDSSYAASVTYGTTLGSINIGAPAENGFQIETYGSTGGSIDRSIVLASVLR